ncbi:hypothetical protein [Paraburkholderia saeva]|uniref:Uncharacterized protein n=1 Tax=Paraburkholderia saeva TaxID=2777537 RepID=A0A9N8X469_9BURK|nr:hypothetical protein [Paraburkholderia saeva]CAG4891290.1 hypothetical protein R70241_01090 [Paraburkholderia saeva]CAG4921783.1 hypothetical protein LMG31841_05127 [Paraburkholderia saeva]CAG4928669.1 hypothetical protein R52603_05729 [Paraburkholderia saeva]
MDWIHVVSWFFGGAFLTNAVPHFVSGVMGRPFQTPFARPRGEGRSSSTVNVLWGGFNFAVAWLLLCRAGSDELFSTAYVVSTGLGLLVMGLMLARWFGRFNGGNTPLEQGAGR